MGIRNKEAFYAIIDNDCAVKNNYITPSGETCAIGALGKDVGYPVEVLLAHGGNDAAIDTIPMEWWRYCESDIQGQRISVLRNLLMNKWGLSVHELCRIQQCNDEGLAPLERRQAIHEYVETLEILG